MWIGNLMLIILNLPMINIWVKLLKVPYRWLFPAIIAFCVIGTYSINNNVFDIWVSIVFGLLGYLFIKLGCEAAPFILGFILGPMMEENLRRALLLSRGDPSVFVTRPYLLRSPHCRGDPSHPRSRAFHPEETRSGVPG